MGTIAAMLVPSCEDSDYGNKPIDLPFQNRNVIGFLLAARSVSYKKSFYIIYSYLHCGSEISFSGDNC